GLFLGGTQRQRPGRCLACLAVLSPREGLLRERLGFLGRILRSDQLVQEPLLQGDGHSQRPATLVEARAQVPDEGADAFLRILRRREQGFDPELEPAAEGHRHSQSSIARTSLRYSASVSSRLTLSQIIAPRMRKPVAVAEMAITRELCALARTRFARTSAH